MTTCARREPVGSTEEEDREEEEGEEGEEGADEGRAVTVGTDMIQILNDVQQLFSNPIFITYT